jgi:6-pyruvoyltetrahydropterin/6-carboxytetrahydropterin synthase
MYELTVQLEFQAAHRLVDYEGKCARFHGHNYRVEVFVAGERLQGNDILLDFGDVKRAWEGLLASFDHQYLNELPAFRGHNATAERLAEVLYRELSGALDTDRFRVTRVRVWETPTCAVTYTPEPTERPGGARDYG